MFENFNMTFDSNFTTGLKSHSTRQLNTCIIQLLIRRKYILFWFNCFVLLNPLNVKSKHSGCEFKYCPVCLKEDFQKLEYQENRKKYFSIDKERG